MTVGSDAHTSAVLAANSVVSTPIYTTECTVKRMARTNIEIDDDLVMKVMQRYGLNSKRAAVDLALRRLAGEPLSRQEALALEGSGWEGDLEEMRRVRVDG